MEQPGAAAGGATAVRRGLADAASAGHSGLTGTLGRAAAFSLIAHLAAAVLVGAPLAGKQHGFAADVLRRPLHATLVMARPGPAAPGVMSSEMPRTRQDNVPAATAAPARERDAAPQAGTPVAARRGADGDASVLPETPQAMAANTREMSANTASQTASPLAAGLPAPRYYLQREVDHPAVPLEHAQLVYPEDALKRRIGGVVVMHLFIGPDGRLERTEVVRAEPPGVFEDAVRDAAAASRFRAAVLGQRPVGSRVTIEVPFDPDCSDFETCASPGGAQRGR